MLHDRKRAWAVLLGLCWLLAGCSGTSNGEDGSGGAGNGTGGSTLRSACLDSCANQMSCGLAAGASCATLCDGVERAYSGSNVCAEAAMVLLECEAAMSCTELDAYVEDYRSSACGAEYATMAPLCAYQPTPPAECVAFCDLAEQCEPDITAGTCADNCNLVLASFETFYGGQCVNDFIDLYACYGTIDCDAISDLLLNQAPPVACDALTQSVNSSCQ